ncbi:MAG: DUF1553 domain-containing protein [Acidobacteria bacterium]|nr:DUF1553 domain-containing protein [Acidobacteriota bacterium]
MRRVLLLVLPLAASGWIDKDAASVLARRNFWAFQKPVRPTVPAVKSPWIRTPVDAFILDALRARSLSPSAPLDRERLLRRVTLDLTGLPPGPAEIDNFLRDVSPKAYETVVDRLLASPHYGERWALRWLDVVRYADTNGYETDAERPHAWRYRDYVVNSFNRDKPYDRFVLEQVAGDELFPGNHEALIATGLHRCGPIHLVGGNQDEEMNRQEVLTEITAAVGQVFLGLTVGCARCHNHKFDPILQSDYYRLQAIFAATQGKDIPIATEEEKGVHEREMKAYEARLEPVKKRIAEIEKPYRARLRVERLAKLETQFRQALEIPAGERSAEQKRLAKEAEEQLKVMWDELVGALSPEDRRERAALRSQMHAINLTRPRPLAAAYAAVNTDKPAPDSYILRVGDPRHKLAKVEPGVPLVIESGATIPLEGTGRRAALARWLTSPENPLTARVMVNRIWQFRMGTGLVATPNDFGALGERPSNPKLLDWLASEFVERGWSVKALDRLVVLSSVYRQSAAADAAKSKADPGNKLYWRMNRKRMEGETIRDNVLAASGLLEPRLGGPPVRIPIEPEVYDLLFTEDERDGLWPVTPRESEHDRRSLYLLNKRTVRLPMMAAFDQPDTMTSCPVRGSSTHALQALSLMNSEFMTRQSGAFAARVRGAGPPTAQIRRAYKLALARAPRPAELSMGERFVKDGGKMEDFCLALLNRHEFVYVP